MVTDETIDLIETPITCEETIEYDNRIEDEVEVEPEEEEHEEEYPRKNWGELEHQFTRYERNYRARRIRELTLAPIVKKRGARRANAAAGSAAA